MRFIPLSLAVGTLVACELPLAAHDTTRAVRIGLTYDPGNKPGVVVLAPRGGGADSIHAILERDLDFGDRVNVIALDAAALAEMARASAPMWAVLAKLGAAAAVQVTPTPAGLHLAVYDVAKQATALVRDVPAPSATNMREWRGALHGISDDVEAALTGTRGIAHTRVAFERAQRIWLVDSDGEGATAVTPPGFVLSPSWSPRGDALTYVTLNPWAVVIRDVQSGRVRTVVSGAGTYISPVFTADGASVVYAFGADNGTDIYTVPIGGGQPRRLSVGHGSENVSPSLSPDGRRIAFTSGRVGHPEIYTMDADGTNVDLLTPIDGGTGAYRVGADWSSNGQSVAFQSGQGSKAQVMIISLRDRGTRQVTSDGANEDPSWAPDGRHLVFVSDRGGSKQLWVLDVETGRTRQLTHGGASVRNPAWSPRF